MDPHRAARHHLDLVDRDETSANEETLTYPADREETFAYLIDRLSEVVARLSNEEFRRLICAMAQARTQAKRGRELSSG